MKVRWLRRLLWFVGFGCLWIPVLDDPPLRTGAYVQDVTTTAATVALITPRPMLVVCTLSTSDGAVVEVRQSAGSRRRHCLRFEGLRPATGYRYSVAEVGGGNLDEGEIRTAPADDGGEVKFAFVGDSGDAPWWDGLQRMPAMHVPARFGWLPDSSEVTTVGAAIAAYGPAFVLHLGDVVYPWGRNAQWTSAFVRPFAEVMRNAPLHAVLGNHDVLDCDGLQILSNLRAPASDETGDGRLFSFAWGPVRVIGLDCNTDRMSLHFDAQHPTARFLERELRSCTEPWIVVASHFPIRSQSRQRDRADLLLSMMPLLAKHQATVYLSGHDHCYQRFAPAAGDDAVPLVVTGGGGKSLYEVRPGRAAALESSYHWCSGVAQGARLTVRAHRLDGTLIETVDLELPRGEALERLRETNPERARRAAALAGR